ncbi:interleukin-21 receptor-like [Heptranchias perlo]|uniref:interleukin-21 receptor-like n=1 Tax=Heptranchias perlo TaxID=212740 RepID=UPI003559C1DE
MKCTRNERNNSHITLQVYLNTRSGRMLHENNCTFTRISVPLPEEEGQVATYTCTMNFLMFRAFQTYRLVLEANSQANTTHTCIVEKFKPSWNIQLNAPLQLSVTLNSTTRKFNFTWQIDDAERYLKGRLEHELEYWSRETREDVKVKRRINDIRHLAIEETELDPDTNYTAWIRSKPLKTERYQGSWSTWSSEIKWRTDPGKYTAA